MKLSANDLREVATFLESLDAATVDTGVVTSCDMPTTISRPGWAHSLGVGSYDDNDGYSLLVGSEY